MSSTLYIAPYALDGVVTVYCREGLSVIEMDFWWLELWLDYQVVLWPVNDNLAAAQKECAIGLLAGGKLQQAEATAVP